MSYMLHSPNRVLEPLGLEVRCTGRGWSLFRGDERLSPLNGTMAATWRRARWLHPELPAYATSVDAGVVDVDAMRDAKRLLMLAKGEPGVRADVAIILAKKMAPATRLLARMKRRPKPAERRLAERMQRLVREGDAPDAAFEWAIREARRASA